MGRVSTLNLFASNQDVHRPKPRRSKYDDSSSEESSSSSSESPVEIPKPESKSESLSDTVAINTKYLLKKIAQKRWDCKYVNQ